MSDVSNDEFGFWNTEYRPSVRDTNPAELKTPPTRNQRGPKDWGIGTILFSVLAFIVVQLAVVIGFLLYLLANQDSATVLSPTSDSILHLSGDLAKIATSPIGILISAASQYVVWLGFMAYATYVRGQKNFRREFWIKFKKTDPLFGALIAWGLIALSVFITWLIPVLFPGANMKGVDNGAFLENLKGGWFWLIAIGIGGIIGPLCEELYFRGLWLQGFRKTFAKFKRTEKYAPLIGLVVSSVFFGLAHFQGGDTVGQILVPIITGTLGLVLGFIVLRTGRFSMNVFVHMFFNTTQLVLSLFFH